MTGGLPAASLLVCTWFGDGDAWADLVRRAQTPTRQGFLADVEFVHDPAFEGLSPRGLAAAHPGNALVSFLADQITLTAPERPVLAVPLPPEPVSPEPHPFRVVVAELWCVENNVGLGYLDWRDFEGAVNADGVFRGF